MSYYRLKRNFENLEKYCFDGIGDYGIPELAPTQMDDMCEFIPFNHALSLKAESNLGIHFFIDDYQFTRVWTKIDRYLSVFMRFKCILTPDFSIYADMPKALQVYNHYRKHWIGAYLQRYGIPVIPTISWSDEKSFEWCFIGEPSGACVAVSSVGCLNDVASLRRFTQGFNEMKRQLEPEKILFWGDIPNECQGNIFKMSTFQDKFQKLTRNGR